MALYISFEVNEDVRLENIRVATTAEIMANQIALVRAEHAAEEDDPEDWIGYWIALDSENAVMDSGSIWDPDGGWGFSVPWSRTPAGSAETGFFAPELFVDERYTLDYWDGDGWRTHAMEWIVLEPTVRLAESWKALGRPCRVRDATGAIIHRAYPEGYTDDGPGSQPQG